MPAHPFVDRVFPRLPAAPPARYTVSSWPMPETATLEAVGVLPVDGVDEARFVARVFDLDHYRGPIAHVEESRVLDRGEGTVRFYQRISVPLITKLHMVIRLDDLGHRDGWRILAWRMDEGATRALEPGVAARMAHNDGAWFVRPGAVGYALGSSPVRDDVGRLKFAALKKGAEVSTGPMLKANIEGMVAWAKKP